MKVKINFDFFILQRIERDIVWQNNLNPSIFLLCVTRKSKKSGYVGYYECDLGSMPASIMTSFSQQMLYKISRLNIKMWKLLSLKNGCLFPRFLPLLKTSTRKNKWSLSTVQVKKPNSIHCPILSVSHKRSAMVPDDGPHNHERKEYVTVY